MSTITYANLRHGLVNMFEGWIKESVTKVLDTSNQSNTLINEVFFLEIATEIINKDDKSQEIYHFLLLVNEKVYQIFTLIKVRL